MVLATTHKLLQKLTFCDYCTFLNHFIHSFVPSLILLTFNGSFNRTYPMSSNSKAKRTNA